MFSSKFNHLYVLALILLFAQSAMASKSEPAPPVSAKKARENRNAEFERTNKYVHKWFKVPSISGSRLGINGTLNFSPRKGRFSVVIFLASWSEPSQQMMKELTHIEK